MSLNQVVQGGGTTLAATYTNITGRTDGWTRFKHLVDAHFPSGQSLGLTTDSPFPLSGWSHADLANLAGAPTAAGNTLVGYVWENVKQVVYLTADGHVHELYARG